MKKGLLALTLVLACGCASQTPAPAPVAAPSLPTSIAESVNPTFRTPENLARDAYRHPAETLTFFEVEPQMTVVEIMPGGGWYLEILAPLLAARGQYISASSVSEKPYQKANDEKIASWSKKFPEASAKMKAVTFTPPNEVKLGEPGTADRVLTFRNVHNWISVKGEKAAFKAFFNVLKKGGILGVVEHRALASQKDPLAKSGYVREQDVLRMAKAAGFKLSAKSEVNANPKDTKDHPEGVWTLPPSLRLGEKDRDKYLAIGESDRMTLKFVKP